MGGKKARPRLQLSLLHVHIHGAPFFRPKGSPQAQQATNHQQQLLHVFLQQQIDTPIPPLYHSFSFFTLSGKINRAEGDGSILGFHFFYPQRKDGVDESVFLGSVEKMIEFGCHIEGFGGLCSGGF